jgi:hypothetical protein
VIPAEAVEAAVVCQVLPAASGYWNLYQLTDNGARFVDKYLTRQDAEAVGKKLGEK